MSELHELKIDPDHATRVAWSASGDYLYSLFGRNRVIAVRVDKVGRQVLEKYEFPLTQWDSAVLTIVNVWPALSDNAAYVFAAPQSSGLASVWKVRTNDDEAELIREGVTYSACFFGSKELVLVQRHGDSPETVVITDLVDRTSQEIILGRSCILVCGVSKDKRYLLLTAKNAENENELVIYDLLDNRQYSGGLASYGVFSPDGGRIAAMKGDQQLALIELNTMRYEVCATTKALIREAELDHCDLVVPKWSDDSGWVAFSLVHRRIASSMLHGRKQKRQYIVDGIETFALDTTRKTVIKVPKATQSFDWRPKSLD
jgi:hypothetical protein